MTDGQTLLAEYARTGSEDAFRELLARYIDLVYSTAVRLVGGDIHLAEDVAQIVFTDLARMAQSLSAGVMIGGWLHRHTCFVASKTLRGERRRQRRERQTAEMNAQHDHTEANLALIAPVLDEAINQLGKEDRAAILLRFFEQLEFRLVGEALGGTEDAARKRVTRALDKLHSLLKYRGVSLSTTALATALATEAVTAAPPGLALGITGPALAGAAAAGGFAVKVFKMTTMAKIKFATFGALMIAVLATPLLSQRQHLATARQENIGLRQRLDQMSRLEAENERLSNLLAAANSQKLSEGELSELLRLRSEVGQLRKMQAKSETVRQGVNQPQPASAVRKVDFYYVAGGGIAVPNRQVFQPGITVMAAIKACGGLTQGAIKEKAELTRAAGDAPLVVDITAIEQGKAPDPEIMPGDKLFVPAPPPDGQ